MFAKFNHPSQYHHLPEQEQEQEEESEASPKSKSGGADGVLRSVPKKPKPDPDSSDCLGGGGSIEEAGKRSRGRPPGSKNKPKHPPLFITAAECAMRPVFLELPVGLDVIDAIARFTHRRNLGLTVLSASGSVTNVSFRQPSTGGSGGGVGIVKFHGRFEILSISATFLPPSLPVTSAPPTPLPSSFTISLVGPQGQIIGGSVAGSLITSSTVYVVAASFENPTYHRLPIEVMVDHQHEESCSNPFKANNVETCSRDGMPPPSSDQDLIWSRSSQSPPF